MKNLLWFAGENFGDQLSPLIFKYFSQQHPTHCGIHVKEKKYVAVGSILNHARKNDIVWGSGIANANDNIQEGIDIRAVRGPLSRKRCQQLNIACPEIYGDPAIILSSIYKPKVDKKYKIGFTPHVVDYDICYSKYKHHKNSIVIDFRKSPQQIIHDMLSCDYIVSSSLHGLIVADSYKIPNLWVKFSTKIIGDDTKFYDHLLTVDKTNTKFLNLINSIKKEEELLDCLEKVEISKYAENDVKKLIEACPFKL